MRVFKLFRHGHPVGQVRADSAERVFELVAIKPQFNHIPPAELEIQDPLVIRRGDKAIIKRAA